MIVWWTGRGWLVPLAPVIAAFAGVLFVASGLPIQPAFLVGGVLGAALVGGVGWQGNKPPAKRRARKAGGEGPRHSFLSIRMEYWAPAVFLVMLLALRGR